MRERRGLGLGLAIARQIAEMHGGTIDASSAGLGRGSTFRVKLPLMVVHPSPDNEPRVHPRVSRTTAAIDTAAVDLKGIHVLAVDDEPDALALIAEVLQAAGARVTTAATGAEAIGTLNLATPDVLVTDLGMPGLDGFALMDRVRRHEDDRVRQLPAAALTAYARSEDRMKALRAGFQMHLAKPIDPVELVTTVAALAKRFV